MYILYKLLIYKIYLFVDILNSNKIVMCIFLIKYLCINLIVLYNLSLCLYSNIDSGVCDYCINLND